MAAALRPYEGVMLKVGMTNPPYILWHLDAVAEVLREPNVFEFMHVPVQSGSDAVLRRMVREYTVDEFRWLVDGLRRLVPGLSLATDIICGFPSENDEDAAQTIALLSEYKFPFVNISQFYARPGTPAARMKQLPPAVVKRRSGEVSALFASYSTYLPELVGQQFRVWFSELDKKFGQTVGHTKTYAKVVVQGMRAELLGTSHMCNIVAVQKWHLTAELA
eukprot:NODE_2224_length_973_cov_278.186275.p1 GENE.NODE_2224_length_973_cov_278.186275~~NODE_2224_length_973_cov_278.186275.p1  ORF type:complete len:220 (+),score=82.93 NODE_2224_length_973_cov_278.186275:136-795(+)